MEPGGRAHRQRTTSKKGRWFFSMHTSAICSHCSRVGSMPVGLCAQPGGPAGRQLVSSVVCKAAQASNGEKRPPKSPSPNPWKP